ncbi:MAG: tetratricopeptide repeat protein [Planctomycetes bacterium]|nr:tetratricopeptide repeat protein [Planctomycetota bacterium]
MLEFMNKYSVFLVCFVLTASTLLVFWQARTFDFVDFDDNDYVYQNQHVSGGLTAQNIRWAFTSGHATNWHPVTWLSLMLDCHLLGLHPGRMHLVNVVLHLANTLLLFAVLRKMTGSLWPSAFVAAAFALHPMHVESVAWITERKDVLSTFFMLLTLAAYAGYVKRPSVFKYIASLILFALGLMAKPMLVTLPFVLLLLDYWPLNRFAALQPVTTAGGNSRKSAAVPDGRAIWYRILIEKIPFFALAAVSSAITFLVQRAGGAMMDVTVLPLQDRVANIFLSYSRYMGKLFWPEDLAALYPFDAARFSFWQIALCAMLVLVISVFVIRLGRTQKYLPVGWLWFVITLIPVIGLVQVGRQAFADRYTYIPYIGLFIMAAWGLPELYSKWPYRNATLGVTAALVLTALGLAAYRQTGYWKNSIILFSHAVEVTENNAIMYNYLGGNYDDLGRHEEAIKGYEQAIRINPKYAEPWHNLGVTYGKLGRCQESIEAYQMATRIDPNYGKSYNNLGVIYGQIGRHEEAIKSLIQAIKIKPDFLEAHNNLGNAYIVIGDYLDAIESFNQAIRVRPDCADAHYNLGNAYANLDRWQEAIEAYGQAIRLRPNYAEALNNLGNAYVQLGRWQEAAEACTQSIRIKPDFAEAHYNLGNAYANLGRWQEAIEAYGQAIRIRPDFAEAYNNLDFCLKAIEAHQ